MLIISSRGNLGQPRNTQSMGHGHRYLSVAIETLDLVEIVQIVTDYGAKNSFYVLFKRICFRGRSHKEIVLFGEEPKLFGLG